MIVYVKSLNAGYVLRYESDEVGTEDFLAEDIPLADSGLSQAEYDALPNYNDVGQPWHVPEPKPLTRTEKVQNLLAAHDLSMDDLLDELEAVKARR